MSVRVSNTREYSAFILSRSSTGRSIDDTMPLNGARIISWVDGFSPLTTPRRRSAIPILMSFCLVLKIFACSLHGSTLLVWRRNWLMSSVARWFTVIDGISYVFNVAALADAKIGLVPETIEVRGDLR